MDDLTLKYYNDNASTIYDRYESIQSGISDYFQVCFPAGARILDIGAGSGRDLRHLLSLGYEAIGIEPSDELRSLSISKNPALTGRMFPGCLPLQTQQEPFDGMVCSAVLMHLPESILFDSLLSMREGLKVHGRLLVSIPLNRPDLDSQSRDKDGRLFVPLQADRLVLLAERLGLGLISRWENTDSLKRQGHDWVTLLFEKENVAARSLDRIQRVLNRDLKVATYKLALLRGFCDIADADERVFDWSIVGKVGVPVNLMVEKWLFYYWPIFASPIYVPQIRSEPGGKPVKFRQSLTSLIEYYHVLGGLDAFYIDYRSENMTNEARSLLKKAWSDIRSSIISGPVKHAEQGSMFSYDTKSKCIYCESDLWKEFCLTGYWIRDALILRWAELTSKLASGQNVGEILGLLLTKPVVDREVSVARKCYLNQSALYCVWSGRTITAKQLAVDHVLPFSLWGNNDLWNLLPSHTKVNGNKSDKIPVSELLHKQRDLIIHNWQMLDDFEPVMFKFEVNRVLGLNQKCGWESDLFNYLKRSCEYGIHIRGIEPWSGVGSN